MLKAVLPLSIVMCLRFLGLFIVLPVISLYAQSFHSSAFLLGLVVGGAYLTQIIFQTPLGILSDKIDRKKVVMAGLFVFMIGSIICAMASDIYMLVIGRLIQGAGAVGGVVSAQIADLVVEEKRTKAMAIMGGGIFASFTLGMLAGPIVGVHLGVDWLFAIMALLTLFSMVLLHFKVPNTPKILYSFKQKPHWLDVFKDKNLFVMNISSFLEKAIMTLVFVIVPLVFVNELDFNEEDLWKLYVPGAILGIFALAPASILAEKYAKARIVMAYGIALFLVAFLLIGFSKNNYFIFVFGVILFFIGFATLEPIMQSLASKYAKAHLRGSALGVFTTCSYVGSFIGAMIGAWLYHFIGLFGVGVFVGVVCCFWLLSLVFLNNPATQKNLYLDSKKYNITKIGELERQKGVIECYVNTTQGVIICKYDDKIINESKILEIASKILTNGN